VRNTNLVIKYNSS